MPIRFGEVFLFGFFVLLLYLVFRDKPRAKEVSRVSEIAKEDVRVASVVEVAAAPEREARTAAAEEEAAGSVGEPTGRKANVAGRGTLFECVEYRCGEIYETRVHRIDRHGKQISPSFVYREPFQKVMESFTTVAA